MAQTTELRMYMRQGKDSFKGSFKIMSLASILIKRLRRPERACMIPRPRQGETGKMISAMNS
jgi:hypothetical protein